MRLVVLACLFAVALAAPRPEETEDELETEDALEVEDEVEKLYEPEPQLREQEATEQVQRVELPKERPQPKRERGDIKYVAILKDERQDSGDGNFNWAIETENGIAMSVVGTPGAEKGQVNMEGSYRLTFPDGTPAEVRFIANEFGFQPESDLLPTPHPLPPHVHELLRIAEQQRAEGITFE